MVNPPIDVLLVDDSPFARRALKRMLVRSAGINVVAEAADGREALALIASHQPDVVVLDLEMPVVGGLEVLATLQREEAPPPVVVVSGAAKQDAELTIQALEGGAFDFVDKSVVSTMEIHALADEVLAKVRAAAKSQRQTPDPLQPVPALVKATPEVLVVGASTGGPQALFQLLGALPLDFPPIVVVQHMPPAFVPPLVDRMADRTGRAVAIAASAQPIKRGDVVFAGGRRNLTVVRRGAGLSLLQRDAAPGTPHVPSVDELFRSAAGTAGARAWGVLLTGMGRDGAEGLLEIRKQGGLTIAQDEGSSAVYGMPRAAVALGAASEILPLAGIAAFLTEAARSVG